MKLHLRAKLKKMASIDITTPGLTQQQLDTDMHSMSNPGVDAPEVLYRGLDIFGTVYEDQIEGITRALRNTEFQEVYLGYSPSQDSFYMGFDLWNVDPSDNCVLSFKLNPRDGTVLNVAPMIPALPGACALFYNQPEEGYDALKAEVPDLLDLRLD